MDYEACQSLSSLFYEKVEEMGDQPFLWRKIDKVYQPLSWNEVAERVKDLSLGLRELGVKPGDRVTLVSENSPEWFIADLAIVTAGAVTVPAYTTNRVHDHQHVLNHSGSVGAIVSTPALAKNLLPAALDAPKCKWVVSIEDAKLSQAGALDLHPWEEVMELGRKSEADPLEVVRQAKRDDICCFIYTSGTGGTPKAVMLSHGNLLWNCHGAYDLLETFGLGHEIFLSFLPLSHSYEHTAGQYFPMSIGAQIYYAEGVEALLTNLAEARPTIMTAVPRLYESMHQRIRRNVDKQGGFKKTLFDKAVEIGAKRYHDPKSLTLKERFLDVVCEHLVRKKVRERFGGRLKAFVSGGAALNPEIGVFFTALGLRLLQGYGQTEASPVISANPPQRVKIHTVGKPLTGVEVKIAEDGEILVRGGMVMKGYWQDEDYTKQTVKEGWLHTGDIGRFDEDGYLEITDRKKDIIVLSGGDNVSPARVEGFLTLQQEIAQAMVYGDKRPALVALLVPDPEWLADWARKNGKPRDQASLVDDAELHKALSAAVDRVNKSMSMLEKVRHFTVADEPFSTENGMMTPTLKIKRHVIKQHYAETLEGLYRK
ncbi:AMP-dependent synthetase/ligase [Limibacillus halophilus]|jgi:long-chain acyl-CoA synthetase